MSEEGPEERIRRLEAEVRRLTAMLHSAPDFISHVSVDGTFLYVNHLSAGYEPDQVLGHPVEDFLPPMYRARVNDALRAAQETGRTQEYATFGPVTTERMGHYLTRISPVVEGDVVKSLVMCATNVTALEESRTLLQVALNATGLGIWTYELASGGGTADETTRRIFGITEPDSELHITSMLQDRIHPDDRAAVAEELTQCVRDRSGYGPIEHRILHPNGELRWVAASGIAVLDHRGGVARVVGSVMDITHRRALESRLSETQKLESIGRLAGGVAHDFNNMLTAILGNLDLASSASSVHASRPLLAEARHTAERCAALTQQLLAFARRQVIELKVLEPSVLLAKLEPLLRRLLGEDIRLSVRLGSEGRVRADGSQLEQVVLNLITNARDSIPSVGFVELTTRDLVVTPESAAQHPEVTPGRYVVLAVADDGAGIPASALPQIFEPFFTTRPGGTGLGLATCYGIVKQSGGHIGVRSELGKGSTFSVYLPRADEPAGAESARPEPTSSVARGERVLLVEDEAVVRNVVERTLQRAKYEVVTATSGEEALEAVEREAPFDLLITDVMMPGMNGWELGAELGARIPSLRVLYMSGYTEGSEVEGAARSPFLQKPFMPAELLTAVRQLLDR
ncbi:MAG: Blue-light-activated protein [Polyangiaceae bacterium]|jgi:PAS domain S-box-containing protein|nr:Blue-light-activated protein [Polyangiaceae bacterium]